MNAYRIGGAIAAILAVASFVIMVYGIVRWGPAFISLMIAWMGLAVASVLLFQRGSSRVSGHLFPESHPEPIGVPSAEDPPRGFGNGYCTVCGAPIEPGSGFCGVCGRKL